jgi:hypothetical protein
MMSAALPSWKGTRDSGQTPSRDAAVTDWSDEETRESALRGRSQLLVGRILGDENRKNVSDASQGRQQDLRRAVVIFSLGLSYLVSAACSEVLKKPTADAALAAEARVIDCEWKAAKLVRWRRRSNGGVRRASGHWRHFSRALSQIATLPATPTLRREEIKLQVALIAPIIHVNGFAAPETKAAVERANLLIERAEAINEAPGDLEQIPLDFRHSLRA